MELENISYEQIQPFFDSLGKEEKELLGIPLNYVLSADYICGVKVGDELAGIGGYIKSYRFVPSSFDVVASKFQGKGIGNELHKRRLEFARKHYSYAVSSVGNPETHQASLHLYYKHGSKCFYKKGNTIWLCISFNQKGKIICKVLPFIYSTFHLAGRLPLGVKMLNKTYESILERQTRINSTKR
jgi:GNAT superfamily N-acetyltransferase